MKDMAERNIGRRLAVWAALIAIVLAIPLVAMQFTAEVKWDAFDFVFAAVLMSAVAIPYELVTRRSGNIAYRAAVGLALAAGFFLIWANGAVGILGDEGEPPNMMFHGVILIGVLGAALSRFRSKEMAAAMLVTALAQVSAGMVALIAGWGNMMEIGLTMGFAAPWLLSAALFHRAARDRAPPAVPA